MKIWCLTAIGFAAALFAVGCGSDGNPSNGNNNGPDIGGQGEDIPAIVNDTVGFGVGKYDKEIREGRISVDSFYIFDKGTWRKTTPQEADGFTEISEVYANLKHDEKAVFIIRHSERTSDTGPEGHLTDNGYIYANNLGKRLAAIRKEDFYYAYSGYTRTHETCEEIAKGNGQQDYVINEQPICIPIGSLKMKINSAIM